LLLSDAVAPTPSPVAQVKEKGFHAGKDERFSGTVVLDEDSEDLVRAGGARARFCVLQQEPRCLLHACVATHPLCWAAPQTPFACPLHAPARAPTPTQLLDDMEPMMAPGGVVVDFHSVALFPERWFDLVLVLRADTDKIFDRLTARYAHGVPHRCHSVSLHWLPHPLAVARLLPNALSTLDRPAPVGLCAEVTPLTRSQRTWSARSCR
jgi:hypothetical protein